jgi:hypothetical protein
MSSSFANCFHPFVGWPKGNSLQFISVSGDLNALFEIFLKKLGKKKSNFALIVTRTDLPMAT